jgi:hypothetical protein
MPKVSETFSSGFYKAADFPKPAVLTIASAALHDFGEGDQKIKLSFSDGDKELVLNKTNASLIADIYGDDTDDWLGKPLAVYKERVTYQGRLVDGIRVKCDPKAAQASSQPAADDSDDMPF